MTTKKLSVPIAQSSLSRIRKRAYIRAGELQGWLKVVPPPRRVTYAPSESNEDLSSITLLSSARIVQVTRAHSRTRASSVPFSDATSDAR